MKPVSTAIRPPMAGTSTVLLWPPGRWSASNSVTRCVCDSSQAAARPEMPLPITATSRAGPSAARVAEAAVGREMAWSWRALRALVVPGFYAGRRLWIAFSVTRRDLNFGPGAYQSAMNTARQSSAAAFEA